MKHLAAFLLLTSALLADPPVPKIDGPTERHPGALTVLDASGSTGDKYAWLVNTDAVQVPKDAAPDVASTLAQLRAMGFEVQEPVDDSEPLWAVSDDGKRLWLSSYPGVYAVTLGVSNADAVVLLPWKVVVSGAVVPPVVVPPVVIPPVVVPPPIVVIPPVVVPSDFPAKLTAAVKANPAADVGFLSVAGTYESVANNIKAGSVLFATPQQVTGFTAVTTAFFSPEWAAIDAAIVKPHLLTLGLTTAAQHEGPWRQIAAAVKAGLTDIPPPVVVPPVVVVPIPVTGLHVLVIEEMDDRRDLPASQRSIFTSTALVDWYDANRVQWRHWDDDADLSQVDKKWRDAMERPRTSLPWVCISNGVAGYEGPLPKTVEATIELLKKYAQ